jgi:hypothetical protein
MANHRHSHESRSDKVSEELPEPLKKASGLLNAGKQLYVRVEKRWGRGAAIAVIGLLVGLVGGLLVWWKWPDIKQRPGIEQVVEWVKQLTPVPTCSGQNFCVAVADLQNDSDNHFSGWIVDAVENL